MLSDDWLRQGFISENPVCLKQDEGGVIVQVKRWFDGEVLQGVTFSFLSAEDVHIEVDAAGWTMLQKTLNAGREDDLKERLTAFFGKVEGRFGEYLVFHELLVSWDIPFQKISFVPWD